MRLLWTLVFLAFSAVPAYSAQTDEVTRIIDKGLGGVVAGSLFAVMAVLIGAITLFVKSNRKPPTESQGKPQLSASKLNAALPSVIGGLVLMVFIIIATLPSDLPSSNARPSTSVRLISAQGAARIAPTADNAKPQILSANEMHDLARMNQHEQLEILVKIAEGQNKLLPQKVDEITTLTKVQVEGDKRYIYNYELAVDRQLVDFAVMSDAVRQQATKYFCTPATGGVLLIMKTDIVYRYTDDKGNQIGDVTIRTQNCP